jgi:PKD repeat protein
MKLKILDNISTKGTTNKHLVFLFNPDRMIHFQLLFKRFRTTSLFTALILLTTAAYSQCIDKAAIPRVGCVSSFVNLKSTGSPNTFTWDFGDATTDNVTPNPAKQYSLSGHYVITLNVTDPVVCTDTFNIDIYELPVADLSLLTGTIQCFKGNQFCFLDNSQGKNGAKLVQRTIDFGDGTKQIDNTPGDIAIKNICHNYIVTTGQTYTVIIEVIDEHGCVHSMEYTNILTVTPDLNLKFTTSYILGCMTTDVTFTIDTGAVDLGDVQSFVWDFGDGTIDSGTSADSAKWTDFIHTYKTDGSFDATLTVTNKYGCVDTYKVLGAGANVFFEFDVPDSEHWQCFKGNSFVFNQTPIFPTGPSQRPGDRLRWNFGDPPSQDKNFDTISFSAAHEFTGAKRFFVSLYIHTGPCDTTFEFDTVDVYGPQAIIEIPPAGLVVKNKNQCMIKDTVYFVFNPNDSIKHAFGTGICPTDSGTASAPSPPFYLSSHYKATQVKRVWSFGDHKGGQCTLDTKKGIGLGQNCNWTVDSLTVSHWYTPGEERCYTVTLNLVDEISLCEDEATLSLPLMAPDACPAPFATPPREGLRFTGIQCLGSEPYKRIKFNLDQTLPQCGRENFWMMWDSTCSRVAFPLDPDFYANGFVKNPLLNLEHFYTSVCDPDGWVTVGLILQNGNDVNCQKCFDTCWYHHMLRYDELNGAWTADYKGITKPCTPRYVEFVPADSTQDSLWFIAWNWRDGTQVIDSISKTQQNTRIRYYYGADGNLDSMETINIPNGRLPRLSHTYYVAGKYRPTITVISKAGCETTAGGATIIAGHYSEFYVNDSIICIGESVNFDDSAAYWWNFNLHQGLDTADYWHKPGRPERFRYNFGDGGTHVGTNPSHTYTSGGTFKVELETTDSNGCKEYKYLTVHVVDVTAKIGLAMSPQPTQLTCAPQFVDFIDSSTSIGASPSPGVFLDSIVYQQWDWDDGKISTINQTFPIHRFNKVGEYNVKLTVITSNGCTDSTYRLIKIIGPTPEFELLDTLGCAPYTVRTRNKSKDATSYSWEWGDSQQSNQTDSIVTHTYTTPGVYCIKMYAIDTVTNDATGAKVTCDDAFYPDSSVDSNQKQICVTVLATPKVTIGADKVKICARETVNFTNTSDTKYDVHRWNFDDPHSGANDSSDLKTPSHKFDSAGTYTVTYTPRYTPLPGVEECRETGSIVIEVSDVVAEFEVDPNEPQPNFLFRNKSSVSAVKFDWFFDADNATTTDGRSYCYDIDWNNDLVRTGLTKSDSVLKHCYGNDTNTFRVCLIAYNADGCTDTVCQYVKNTFFIGLKVYNVFTPPAVNALGDNFNDAFDIDIHGEEMYDLVIYNRWGERVFEGKEDGEGNDGKNWNGKLFNTGKDCAEGVYYYVFKYKLRGSEPDAKNGSITLIR